LAYPESADGGDLMVQASKVVVVVFDGLRPDMVTAEWMPHLHAFAEQGCWFRDARSVFPSMTRVATASIATGAPPAVHGVVGNSFYFPTVARDFVLDTSSQEDLALAERVLGESLIGPETFADRLAANGKSFAVVHAGSAGSAYAINPRVAANGHWTFSVLGEGFTRTPQAVRDVVRRFGPLPARELPRFQETDYVTRAFIEHVLADLNPDVALIWFNEPDTSFHYKFLGSPETRAVTAAVDASFGRILAAIRARPDADDVAILAVSDHGQISSSGLFEIAPMLAAAGHPAVMARQLGDAKVVVTGGNMGEIRMRDGDLDRRDAIARWLMERPEIGMVFTPSDDPVHGGLDGTFSHQLAGIDHPRAAELMYVLRSGLEPDPYGLPGLGLITGGVPVGGGMHGGFNRHELNTVLILGGAAHRGESDMSFAPAGIIDIAPTILDLLGLEAPASMRGVSLLSPELRATLPQRHEVGTGAFRQQLIVAPRGTHLFPQHGERVR
jgi:phosphonoacetate hydrolase